MVFHQDETLPSLRKNTGKSIRNQAGSTTIRWKSCAGPKKLLPRPLRLRASDLAAIGITNQREATIVSTASGDLLLGNVDTFLLSNLTGGAKGGVRITKLTNASRTQLLQP
jgi:glycerol kinase